MWIDLVDLDDFVSYWMFTKSLLILRVWTKIVIFIILSKLFIK